MKTSADASGKVGTGRRTVCLVLKAEYIPIVGCLQCTFVVVFSTLENLSERTKVDAKGKWTVAAVQREPIRVQLDRDKCDMGIVHRLQVL